MKKKYLLIFICLISITSWAQSGHQQAAPKDSLTNELNTVKSDVEEIKNKLATIEKEVKENQSKGVFTKSNFYLSIVLLSASLFLSFIVVWIFYLLFRKDWSRDRIIDEVLSSTRIKRFITEHIQANKPNNQIVNIDSIVKQAVELIMREQSYIDMVKKQSDLTNSNSNQSFVSLKVADQQPIPTQSKDFYCIEPNENTNYFFADKTTLNFRETISVYQFKSINENLANFKVVEDGDTMKRAIASKSYLLNAACESIGTSHNAQKIINDKSGTVKKEGDKWVIVTKAKIKFV